MSIDDDFQAAVAKMNSAAKAPSPGEQLKLYGLFKQVSQGENTGKRPGMTKVRDRAKFDAWAANKGVSKESAVAQYIALVDSLTQQRRYKALPMDVLSYWRVLEMAQFSKAKNPDKLWDINSPV